MFGQSEQKSLYQAFIQTNPVFTKENSGHVIAFLTCSTENGNSHTAALERQ